MDRADNRSIQNHWAISVSGNWRLTFYFEDGDAVLTDYQDTKITIRSASCGCTTRHTPARCCANTSVTLPSPKQRRALA
ncbi:MAG: type II toxin-antitoxin system RelE/ParE family toxin [Ottowia sp.]|nr:type II toxin-antitoxin system RelE/ParE family toxin [Ottowia sp.]